MKAKDVKGTKSNKIVEQRGRPLPKKLYAKYVLDKPDAPWLDAAEEIEGLAEKDETLYVGEYKLVKVHKVSLVLKVV